MPELAPALNQPNNNVVRQRQRRPPPQPARKFGTTLTLSAANSKAQSASL